MAEPAKEADCILIIDGEVLVRHAISDYLRQCGYVVIEAASIDEAQTVLSGFELPIAAILCDANAPGAETAFEFRLRVRQTRPELEVILAGNIDAAARKAAELCEQGPHLSRPYDPQSVVTYIRKMLADARGEAPSPR